MDNATCKLVGVVIIIISNFMQLNMYDNVHYWEYFVWCMLNFYCLLISLIVVNIVKLVRCMARKIRFVNISQYKQCFRYTLTQPKWIDYLTVVIVEIGRIPLNKRTRTVKNDVLTVCNRYTFLLQSQIHLHTFSYRNT